MTQAALFGQNQQLPQVSEHWFLSRDGDPYGYDLYQRHYSSRRYSTQRQRLFVGPGRKLVLLNIDATAMFAWRAFQDDVQPKQTGWNCAVFRNESEVLSSVLIKEAVAVVFSHWGRNRCYTLVNPMRVKSVNPGCCFKKAGWKQCAVSKTGKLIFALEVKLHQACSGSTGSGTGGAITHGDCQS